MIFVDDFLTRRYWDQKPYPFGLGTNVELNYLTMTVEEELNALRELKKRGIEFHVFMVGYVLDMALGRSKRHGLGGSNEKELRNAVNWLLKNDVKICGHGYLHTEPEYRSGYRNAAKLARSVLELLDQTPLVWRFPREQVTNEEYIKKLGFEIPPVDGYLDNRLLLSRRIDFLGKYKRGNYVVHSLYLAKIVNSDI